MSESTWKWYSCIFVYNAVHATAVLCGIVHSWLRCSARVLPYTQILEFVVGDKLIQTFQWAQTLMGFRYYSFQTPYIHIQLFESLTLDPMNIMRFYKQSFECYSLLRLKT